MPKRSAVNGSQLDKLVILMQHSVAIQLAALGVSQALIAKKLGIATATVNAMLKGIDFQKE